MVAQKPQKYHLYIEMEQWMTKKRGEKILRMSLPRLDSVPHQLF